MSVFSQFVAQQLALPATVPSKPKLPPLTGDLAPAALEHIRSHPNQDVREIADALNVATEQLYPVLQKLKRREQIIPKSRVGNRYAWVAL